MHRDYDDRYDGRESGRNRERYYEGRDDRPSSRQSGGMGGYRPPQFQDRNEYGQFTGSRQGGRSDRYENDYHQDRGMERQSSRSSYPRYDEDYDRNRERSNDAGLSRDRQDRDEYGRYTGYGNQGGYGSRYEYERSDPGYPRADGRGGNLSYEDRVRGGQHSAREQDRNEYGQFTGSRGERSSNYYDDRDVDRGYPRGNSGHQRDQYGQHISSGPRFESRW